MSEISASLDSLSSAFGTLFSILPPGWGQVLTDALIIFIIFAIVKVGLDLIGSFL